MRTREMACSYCHARAGEKCTIVLDPSVTVTTTFQHRARQEANETRQGAAL